MIRECLGRCRALGVALLFLLSALPALGWVQDDTDLAKQAQNPVADLISVRFKTTSTSGSARTTTSSTSSTSSPSSRSG